MNIIEQWCEKHKGNPDFEYDIRDFTLNTAYYQRLLDKMEPYHICRKCGKPEFSRYENSKELKDKSLCFGCGLWTDRMKKCDKYLIINGTFYSDAGNKPNCKKSQFLGHGGRVFRYVRLANPEKLHVTNNLWHGGKCPSFFNPIDNAKFVEGEQCIPPKTSTFP